MPIEITESAGDDLALLKMEVGDKFRGVLIDLDEVPHMKFDDPTVQETSATGHPKTKWIARLRRTGATDPADDVKWWTQNQVKYELRQAVLTVPRNHLGAEIGIERLPDAEPKRPGYKGAASYRVVIITPGPDNWVDPLTATATFTDADLDEF